MSRSQSTILLKPTDAPFDNVSATVPLPVKPRVARFVASRWDHGRDLPTTQIGPDRAGAVPLVSGHALGPASLSAVGAADFRGRQKWLREQALMSLSRRGQDLQRNAVTIGHQVQFRAKSAARTAQSVVGGLPVRTIFSPRRQPSDWLESAWRPRTTDRIRFDLVHPGASGDVPKSARWCRPAANGENGH